MKTKLNPIEIIGVLFILGGLLAVLAVTGYTIHMGGYDEGQKDALNGNWKYKLSTNEIISVELINK